MCRTEDRPTRAEIEETRWQVLATKCNLALIRRATRGKLGVCEPMGRQENRFDARDQQCRQA